MSDILRVDVLAIAPELSSLSDLAWVYILDYVNKMSPSGFCGDMSSYRMARMFYAAHMGTTTKRGVSGATGPVLMEAAGGLRRTYGNVVTSEEDITNLQSTPYGRQYLTILQAAGCGLPLVP